MINFDKIRSDTQRQNWCAEIKSRAERHAGELLREMEKHSGHLKQGPRLHDETTGPADGSEI